MHGCTLLPPWIVGRSTCFFVAQFVRPALVPQTTPGTSLLVSRLCSWLRCISTKMSLVKDAALPGFSGTYKQCCKLIISRRLSWCTGCESQTCQGRAPLFVSALASSGVRATSEALLLRALVDSRDVLMLLDTKGCGKKHICTCASNVPRQLGVTQTFSWRQALLFLVLRALQALLLQGTSQGPYIFFFNGLAISHLLHLRNSRNLLESTCL